MRLIIYRKFIIIIFVSIILTLFLYSFAYGKLECLDCHDDSIEMERYQKTAHYKSDLGCTDCHSDIKSFDEDKSEHIPKPMKVDCGECHGDIQEIFAKSFHGRSKNIHVAHCKDCHGTHYIGKKDPESKVYRLNISETCASCHMNKELFSQERIEKVEQFFKSSHGFAIKKAGLLLSATCSDCHDYHNIEAVSSKKSLVYRDNLPRTCGRCHAGIIDTYNESAHGQAYLKGNKDVPVCIDCHESHNIRTHLDPEASIYPIHIAETCAKCHKEQRMIKKYRFPEAQVETFYKSYHGAATKLGDSKVANCGSCHGYHDIRKASDPKSSIHPNNLKATCSQCHAVDDPNKLHIKGKIHIASTIEDHWITNIVEKVYILLISFSVLFYIAFIFFDFRRKKKDKSNRCKKGSAFSKNIDL